LAAIVVAFVIGAILPEPFVTGYAPVVLVLPMLLALLVAPAYWTLVVGSMLIMTLLARAGFSGVYTQPSTLIILGTINGTVVVSRLMIERSLFDLQQFNCLLEERVRERTSALTAQTARANRLLEERKQLYSSVAHDLRNDALVLTNLADELTEAWHMGDTREAQAHERRMLRVVRRQVSYARDLTDVSLIAEGEGLPMRPTVVSLPEIAVRLMDDLSLEARPCQITMLVETRPGVSSAWCDPDRVERVMRNLIGNALKAVKDVGDPGMVKVVFAMDGATTIRCEVNDTGIGIAPEGLHQLGHRFVRVSLPGVCGDGLGLGLTLSAQLVNLMGGTLHIDSLGRGHGTTVLFTIPAYTAGQELPDDNHAPTTVTGADRGGRRSSGLGSMQSAA
ncbi:MAG: HAMP domain-containing sensor histidine kinase, partial [Chloroflexales bacterium]